MFSKSDNNSKGMPLIATKDYNAGDIISDCSPILHCIREEYKGKHCDNCFQSRESLKVCSKCNQMFYCDKRCQQNDWKYHKNECKVYRHEEFDIWGSTVKERLLIRLLLWFESDREAGARKYRLFEGKEFSLNDINVKASETVFERFTILTTLSIKLKAYKIKFSAENMFRFSKLVFSEKYVIPVKEFFDSDPKKHGFIDQIGAVPLTSSKITSSNFT